MDGKVWWMVFCSFFFRWVHGVCDLARGGSPERGSSQLHGSALGAEGAYSAIIVVKSCKFPPGDIRCEGNGTEHSGKLCYWFWRLTAVSDGSGRMAACVGAGVPGSSVGQRVRILLFAATWMERSIPPFFPLLPPPRVSGCAGKIGLTFEKHFLGVSIQWLRLAGDAIASHARHM